MDQIENPRMHFVHPYLIAPTNPIIVNVIGAGGTGSHFIYALGKINFALRQFGHAGLFVRAFDPDYIETPNFGRPTFNQNELGMNKAVAVINTVNRFYGTNWKAIKSGFEYTAQVMPENRKANITISCIDDVRSRFNIAEILCSKKSLESTYNREKSLYWIDCGNGRNTGQMLFSTIGDIEQPISQKYITVPNLITVTDEYGDLLFESERSNPTPSCSFADANENQDLFTNEIIAKESADMLWKMLRNGYLTHRGFFDNLITCRREGILV